MSKKTSRGAVSKPQKTQKSSISKSAFAPSHLQLALFASVIQGLDGQHLRIHDTNTGRLRCDHAAAARTRITSLEWGYYGTSYRENLQQGSKKKRKRTSTPSEHAVVAYGNSGSEICMFSPAEGKVIGKLGGVHERGIRDFKFWVGDYLEGWSIGGDGKLVQWDMRNDQATRTISLPDPSITTLASPAHTDPQLICASTTPFSVHLASDDQPTIESFDSFKNPIHSLFRSGIDDTYHDETFLAADSDRYINIYDLAQKRLLKTLIAESEVKSIDFYTPSAGGKGALSEQLLAVVTREGVVELFARPFLHQTAVNGDLKSKRKNLTSKANAKVSLVRPDSNTALVPIFSASLQGPELVVATTDGGVDVAFQKIRWQDEGNGELLFDGTKVVKHSRATSTLNTATLNGVKDMGKSYVDESNAVVVSGAAQGSSHVAAIEILSSDDGQEAGESDSSNDEAPEEAVEGAAEEDEGSDRSEDQSVAEVKVVADVPKSSQDQKKTEALADDEVLERVEPSFGELLAQKHPGTISIADALQPVSSIIVAGEGSKPLLVPSGISLSTVLTQSLRTNDQNLLESCLHSTDPDIIKLTIQRLDSSLAGILLQKLAERLASRPGRYGHLLIWVQWTCIVHGGAIAGRPDILSKVQTLYNVLTERSKSLDNLLLLKGKLDMLDAQLTFRRNLQARRGARRAPEEDPAVIYVEDEGNWSSDEDEVANARSTSTKSKTPKKALKQLIEDVASSESSSDEDMPNTNGILNSDEDDESASDSDAPGPQPKSTGLLDDEAEESHPSDDEEEEESSEDSNDEEEDSEMDDFINDDVISEVEDEDEVMIEGDQEEEIEAETPEKPPKKKSRKA